MIFGKTKYMKNLIIILFCLTATQTFSQTKDASTIFAQAEEQLSSKNYNEALSKLTLYENLTNASKEKAQVLRVQIYRELALKDSSQITNYNNAVEVLKNMFAEGKKVNSQDLFRILKEQQEFDKDASTHGKENLNAISTEINIDGIKIGMNVEEIPSQIAANFDWSEGIKGQANSQMNYIPLIFIPKKIGTGNAFNFKNSGIQNITADDRTRRVIQVSKTIDNDKYKKKVKTGFSKYNLLVDELKAKYGEENITVNPVQQFSNKMMGREITSESYNTIIRSKSVTYTLSYVIINDETYSIIENMTISDYTKN